MRSAEATRLDRIFFRVPLSLSPLVASWLRPVRLRPTSLRLRSPLTLRLQRAWIWWRRLRRRRCLYTPSPDEPPATGVEGNATPCSPRRAAWSKASGGAYIASFGRWPLWIHSPIAMPRSKLTARSSFAPSLLLCSYGTEDALFSDEAHCAVTDFFALLGLQTKPSKAHAPAKEHVVQGVDLSLEPENCGHCEAPGPHLGSNRRGLAVRPAFA